MNLVVLHTLILVTQLSLLTYGKPSIVEPPTSIELEASANTAVKNEIARNFSEDDNFMKQVLNKMTPDPASACNE
jgi:hypothetical protein